MTTSAHSNVQKSGNASAAENNSIGKEEIGPCVPELYFQPKMNDKIIGKDNGLSVLPGECLSHITSYLNWGDYFHLQSVNQGLFGSIVDDAATHGGKASQWELAVALLEGTHGLCGSNPSLAFHYLHNLTGLRHTEDADTNLEVHISALLNETNSIDTNEDEGDSIPKLQESKNAFPAAMRKLAQCYLEGNGVEKMDEKKGLYWLKAAFLYGEDVDAAYEIAMIYEYARYGIDVDVVLAAKWFYLAACGGHVEAMAEYGMCCELGCGVDQSDEDALEWYTRAARLGNVTANYSVGEIFEEARGVPQSDSEAVLWYYKAALMGDADSRRALERLQDISRIVIPGYSTALLHGERAGTAQS